MTRTMVTLTSFRWSSISGKPWVHTRHTADEQFYPFCQSKHSIRLIVSLRMYGMKTKSPKMLTKKPLGCKSLGKKRDNGTLIETAAGTMYSKLRRLSLWSIPIINSEQIGHFCGAPSLSFWVICSNCCPLFFPVDLCDSLRDFLAPANKLRRLVTLFIAWRFMERNA